MLKVVLFAYSQGIISSRGIERARQIGGAQNSVIAVQLVTDFHRRKAKWRDGHRATDHPESPTN